MHTYYYLLAIKTIGKVSTPPVPHFQGLIVAASIQNVRKIPGHTGQ